MTSPRFLLTFILALVAGALTGACSPSTAVTTSEECFIDLTLDPANMEPATSPRAALDEARDSIILAKITDAQLDSMAEQLDGEPTDLTVPITVGDNGATVTLTPAAQGWTVTRIKNPTDC